MKPADDREEALVRAALKIIKLGMDTRQVVARFESEGQAMVGRLMFGGLT